MNQYEMFLFIFGFMSGLYGTILLENNIDKKITPFWFNLTMLTLIFTSGVLAIATK